MPKILSDTVCAINMCATWWRVPKVWVQLGYPENHIRFLGVRGSPPPIPPGWAKMHCVNLLIGLVIPLLNWARASQPHCYLLYRIIFPSLCYNHGLVTP